MRGCCRLLLVLAVVLSACGEQDAVFHAEQATAVVTSVRERFEIFDELHRRSLAMKAVEGGFRPVDPPAEIAVSRVSSAVGAVWREPGEHQLRAELPARARGVMRLSNGPVTLEVRPVGARDVAGAVAHRSVVYREAYPGADSILLAEKERVEEFILLRDTRAPRRVEYELKVIRGGGQVRQLAGVVEVLDSRGIAWLRLERPLVVDREGRRHRVTASLAGGRLVLELPARVRRHPALLDPGWTTTGSMAAKRTGHMAALLGSGKVLVAGGVNMGGSGIVALSSAELYDPGSGTWTATGSMNQQRSYPTATLLGTDKVLVVGGTSASAELFDPATGTWTATGSMNMLRGMPTATRLKTGQILVVGGGSHSTELYNPGSGTWTATGSMNQNHYYFHAATLLGTGKVLVSGGTGKLMKNLGPELYDPGSGTWTAAGSKYQYRFIHTATLLKTGKVLVAGGRAGSSIAYPLSSAELYDPGSGTWTATGSLSKARGGHTATRLGTGKVLVAGGKSSSAELYDPGKGTWTTAGKMSQERTGHTATLLKTGKVLVAGGVGSGGYQSSAELYNPTSGLPCKTGTECTSGFCVDGICCETACQGTCEECVVKGGMGICAKVAKGQQDPFCAASMVCDGVGACIKVDGQACTGSAECLSGYCADGVCCGTACKATCKACDVKGKAGQCTNIPDMQPDNNAASPCTGNQACDGKGLCHVVCAGATCPTDHCVDGSCCDTACTETCRSCGMAGSQGHCSDIPAGQTDTYPVGTCSGTQACDGNGKCKLGVGQKCTQNSDCANATCSTKDKVCCKTTCDAICMTCDLDAKTRGTCQPMPKDGTSDKDCIGKDAKCGGECDGKGGCGYPGLGTICGSCKACDGTGRCASTPPDDSSCGVIDCDKLDTKCRDYQDITADRCDSFGSCKAANDSKACTKYTALVCGDATTPDLGPRSDQSTGPDQGSADGQEQDTGCSCRISGSGGTDGGLVLLLMVLSLGLLRLYWFSGNATS